MTSVWMSFKGNTELNSADSPVNILAPLLNQLLATVAQQHPKCTLTEDHWAEADIKQILKDSMDDIDTLMQSSEKKNEAMAPLNDIIKHVEFVCEQFEERCLVMEQDMSYCVDKFEDVGAFNEGRAISHKPFLSFCQICREKIFESPGAVCMRGMLLAD